MSTQLEQLNAAVAALEEVTILAKARVSAYTRKDGTFVAEHDDKRQAAKKKAPASGKPQAGSSRDQDHGTMRFSYKDRSGNEHRLHVAKDRVWAVGGPDQRTPISLSNYMFMDSGPDGTAAKGARLKESLQAAYHSSKGDPKKVLAALKDATKLQGSWAMHSHEKPASQP